MLLKIQFYWDVMWCVVGKMFPAFLNCSTLKIKVSHSFWMFGTTHPVTVTHSAELQSHVEFLEHTWWKSKISVNNTLCHENMQISGQNTWLQKLGFNTICELPHQTFLHTHTGNWYRHYPGPYLHTRTSEYLRNCLCLCPQIEVEGIICLVLCFCLNMETQPPLITDYVHSITSQNKSDMSCWHILDRLVMFHIPMIPAIRAVKLSDPPLPAHLSATTMLATIGCGCFMNLSSTSRHELTFWSRVPPANIR